MFLKNYDRRIRTFDVCDPRVCEAFRTEHLCDSLVLKDEDLGEEFEIRQKGHMLQRHPFLVHAIVASHGFQAMCNHPLGAAV